MQPHDTGPIYKETLGNFAPIVEPWNTLSNLVFLVIVIYWAFKVYRNFKTHIFLGFVLPILFTGFVGGVMYHGTRSSAVWLVMDWAPIALLTLSVAIFFCIKNKFPWYLISFIILFPFIANSFIWTTIAISQNLRGMIGYSLMGLEILLPLIYFLFKAKWQNGKWILFSLLSFTLAVFFRTIDNSSIDVLPMGTHFLWHILGALASNFLIVYLFKLNDEHS